ncbi:MAG: hypothetical protein DI529_17100, partial [Chryseobacterium sp.]
RMVNLNRNYMVTLNWNWVVNITGIYNIVIDKIYRFTGLNDLEDEAILYAMRNQKDGAKGIFVNGYGTYSDSVANSIIEQIAVNEDDNNDWTKEI